MAASLETPPLEKLTLDAELAVRRARRMLEWMRVICENEAYVLQDACSTPRENSGPVHDSAHD
jgi:hypothetical protein